MKKIIVLLGLLMNFTFAHAHSNNDLAEAMKEMGEQFKTIALGIKDGEVEESHLDATESLQMAISTASLHYPNTATTDALKLKYSKWMAELVKHSLDLENAMEKALIDDPKDLSEITPLFVAMNELRKEGHAEFKEDH